MAIDIYQQPITPNYNDLPTYSKGPSQNYYNSVSGDSWLNLRLNRAQEDDDDEWGRTETIALRSIIDHVTGIWQTLYGTGGAGSEPLVTSVIGALQGVLEILNVDATPENSTITIDDTIINKDGITIGDGTYLKEGLLYLNSGILLNATGSENKFFNFHDNENFYLKFRKDAITSAYSMQISIPTGSGSIVHSFNNSEVYFDTQVSFSAGDTDVTTLDVSSSANIATFLTIGNIFSRSKITDSSITLKFNDLENNTYIGNADGAFYITCGNARIFELFSISIGSWIKFRTISNSIAYDRLWIRSSDTENLIGLRGGASLRFVNQDTTAYENVVSDAQIRAKIGTLGYFGVYSGESINTSLRLTGSSIKFYENDSLISTYTKNGIIIESAYAFTYNGSGSFIISEYSGTRYILLSPTQLKITNATNISIHMELFNDTYGGPMISFYNGSITTPSGRIFINGADQEQLYIDVLRGITINATTTSNAFVYLNASGRIDIESLEGISLHLPEGDTGLADGDLYVDTGDGYTVKVKYTP